MAAVVVVVVQAVIVEFVVVMVGVHDGMGNVDGI